MQNRWVALDELRGIAVLSMVLAPILIFPSIPFWMKHASNGLYLADLVLPIFLFSIGVSYRLSFKRRRQIKNIKQLLRSYLFRYGILMLFGLLGEVVLYRDMRWHWSVLEAIGFCGMLVLPALFLDARVRSILAIASLLAWQAIISLGYAPVALRYDLGGPLASLGWCSIILAGTVVADLKSGGSERKFLFRLVVATAFLAGVSGIFLPVSKLLVTLPYVAIGIGVPALLLLCFTMGEGRGLSSKTLVAFGENPLFLYILSGFEFLIIKAACPLSLGFGAVMGTVGCMVFVFWSIARLLDRGRIYVRV